MCRQQKEMIEKLKHDKRLGPYPTSHATEQSCRLAPHRSFSAKSLRQPKRQKNHPRSSASATNAIDAGTRVFGVGLGSFFCIFGASDLDVNLAPILSPSPKCETVRVATPLLEPSEPSEQAARQARARSQAVARVVQT